MSDRYWIRTTGQTGPSGTATGVAASDVTFAPTGTIAAANVQAAIAEVATDAAAAYQPLDSDLTAIAALSTTTYGRAILTLANQAALMALLSASSDTAQGIVELATNAETSTGTDATRAVTPAGLASMLSSYLTTAAAAAGYQPLDSDLTAIAALSTTTYGRSLLALADAAAGRTSLGLGSIATQASNNVTITGGSITGITDLAVADGGTGASTASGARTNLGVAGPDMVADNNFHLLTIVSSGLGAVDLDIGATLHLHHVWLPFDCDIDGASVRLGTAGGAGSTARLVWYRSVNGRPSGDAVLDSRTFATDVAAPAWLLPTWSAVTLTAGWYLVGGFGTSGSTARFGKLSTAAPIEAGYGSDGQAAWGLRGAAAYGPPPSSPVVGPWDTYAPLFVKWRIQR